ncbi:MAG: peptidylprolyl isomerase [Burkholderiaceae bacterium]
MPKIAAGSHVTLHYRLAVTGDGAEREVVSTFGSSPATLQVGAGQFAPSLEACLLGLEEGARATFDLPDDAFGKRNPQLVQALSRAAFDTNAAAKGDHAPGDVVEFDAPGGGRFAGVVTEHGEHRVVVDFNHPLAGRPLRFSVHVIGVL